ncbi:MAG: aminotransferase class V-fold PLP-dependent enzyme [Tissierellales bacterium]|nr:aminotransferase class V-fold PLP-dependent enzyme [Tissierellales bacterium]
MNKIYLDNAATSFPKAPGVSDSMKYYIDNIGTNINRGGYSEQYKAEEIVFDTREILRELFNGEDSANCIFTQNITQSLNTVIKGYLKHGDHVIVSSMEHNAVMRPLVQLEKKGINFTRVMCDEYGRLNALDIEMAIKKDTRLVVLTHASNVSGTILPIKEVGEICEKHGIKFIVDTAQTAGCIELDMKENKIDVLAFTGHKGLMGPQGIGGFLVSNNMANEIEPLISGGTGSMSDSEEIPSFMPDKFESGTLNIPGIFGLNEALKFMNRIGISNIYNKEMNMAKRFIEGLNEIDRLKIIGLKGIEGRVSTISIDCIYQDNAIVSHRLDSEFNIMTRCGLHCAPSAHKTLGTFPQGTIRFSIGYHNTIEEIDEALVALKKILY